MAESGFKPTLFDPKALLLKVILFGSVCALGRNSAWSQELWLPFSYLPLMSWVTLDKSVYQMGLYCPIWQMRTGIDNSWGPLRFNGFMILGIWVSYQEFNFSLMSAGLNLSFWGGCILSQTSVTKVSSSKSRIKRRGGL